jgi:hypothetical protein
MLRGIPEYEVAAIQTFRDTFGRVGLSKTGGTNRMEAEGGLGAVETVNEIATVIGGRLKNVKSRYSDGSTRIRQLRVEHLGHQIEIEADHESMMIDIEARFGQFTLLYVNPWEELYGSPWDRRPAACIIHAATGDYKVYTYGNKLSAEQAQLIEAGTLQRLIETLRLSPEEMMNISQRLVRFDLKKPSAERALAAIHAVISLMPHESFKSFKAYDELPTELQPLIPFISKWGISDDEERWQKLRRSARSTRQKLVEAVMPMLPAINKYLDTFKSEPLPLEACELGDLCQAALEAQRLMAEDSEKTKGT